ncbi:type VII secretion protein EccC [Tsukamurella sp. 1534]|uniref:type VII secretion protein EccC n=1 Tax=Tsukamurella sp. 1534 TaxID=1151061 RepID=UPI0002EB7241|nr:type VII secretion protein EccC [Tsukamurella sp. 1534]
MSRQVFEPPLHPKKEPRVIKKEVEVRTPDTIDEVDPPGKWRTVMMPVVMVVAVLGMLFMMIRMNRGFNPVMLLMPMMLLFGMFAYMGGGPGGSGGKSRAQLLHDRKQASRSIGGSREKALARGRNYHEALQHAYPDPAIIASLIGGERMWEVNGGDEDRRSRFTAARYGRGRIVPKAKLRTPEAPDGEFLDPVQWTETVKFLHTHSTVADMPVAFTLRNVPVLGVGGDRDRATGMARAMINHLAITHGPDRLRLVVVTDEPDGGPWEYTKWLPHTQHPTLIDALGSRRMLYRNWTEFLDELAGDDSPAAEGERIVDYSRPFTTESEVSGRTRHTVVIVDSAERSRMTDQAISSLADLTWILLSPPESVIDSFPHAVLLTVDEAGIVTRWDSDLPHEPPKEIARADHLDLVDAHTTARRLARWELETTASLQSKERQDTGRDWASLVEVEDPGAIDVVSFWQRIKRFDDPRRLNFPIGFAPDGTRIHLNIREASQGGTGPHGEMIGTSGSGKSEFLRCLVLDACLFHSPTMLNLLLVDFKGGATYQGMEEIPHVAAVVTNLEKSESMVDRMMEVITGELKRRQQIFDDAAAKHPSFNIIGLTEYEKARETGHCPDLEPMPALVVLIDEYTELLEAKPEFVNIFSQIGRVGRSVGVHLLLASQNAEMARSRGLESNIHYHIALRTGTAGDSRAVIGVPDAKNLPGKPGNGLIKTLHEDDLIRFYAGFTGKPYFPPAVIDAPVALEARPTTSTDLASRGFTARRVDIPDLPEDVVEDDEIVRTEEELLAAPTVFTVVKELLQNAPARPAYKPWLPELTSTTLDAVEPSLAGDAWEAPEPSTPATLKIPFGMFDDPAKHQQPVWELDLSGGQGNVLIYGAPQKGKTTAAMTLVASLALTHSPEQVQFFVVDYTGGGWMRLEDLPHVSRIATRSEEDAINRMITQMSDLIEQRVKLFRKYRVNSMAEYRRLRADRSSPVLAEDAFGDVFIVVDGFDATVTDGGVFEDKVPMLEALASGALNYGVHIVVTTARNTVLRGLASHMHTIIEGRVSTASYDMSVVNSQRNKVVPDRPGHVITTDRDLMALVALPRADGDRSPATLSDGIEELVERVRRGNTTGASAPQLLALPEVVLQGDLFAHLPDPTSDRDRVRLPFGVRESDGGPAVADFGREAHMLVVGESGSGRSATVHTLIEAISRRYPSIDDGAIALLDPKRVHRGAFAPNPKNIGLHGSDLLDFLQRWQDKLVEWMGEGETDPTKVTYRRVPDTADSASLARRDWWTGPEIFLIIDDYDAVVARGDRTNPVTQTVKLMNDGVIRGFHVIVALSDGEYLYKSSSDPMIQHMDTHASMALVLSADKFNVNIAGERGQRFGIPGRGRLFPGRGAPSGVVQVAWNGVRRGDADSGDDVWG